MKFSNVFTRCSRASIFCFLASSLFSASLHAQAPPACVFGSFDETRINYGGGPLNGTAHDTLRSIIEGTGAVVAAGTPTLTDIYLDGVDVFYTSLLSQTTGTLSGAEQTALQNWIASGGTLIVTADVFPLAAYESFTSVYGVTGYSNIGNSDQLGSTTSAHPITVGVTTYEFTTESTFSTGGDAQILGDNGFGDDFMAVLEPATGFAAGGRILVTGDHNMFTESRIGEADNTVLAGNIATWACSPLGELVLPVPVPVMSSRSVLILTALLILLMAGVRFRSVGVVRK